jgi:hypothetical protein
LGLMLRTHQFLKGKILPNPFGLVLQANLLIRAPKARRRTAQSGAQRNPGYQASIDISPVKAVQMLNLPVRAPKARCRTAQGGAQRNPGYQASIDISPVKAVQMLRPFGTSAEGALQNSPGWSKAEPWVRTIKLKKPCKGEANCETSPLRRKKQ